MTPQPELLQELAMDEMHLAQIGLRRVARNPRAVLDGGASMRVAIDAEAGYQPDRRD